MAPFCYELCTHSPFQYFTVDLIVFQRLLNVLYAREFNKYRIRVLQFETETMPKKLQQISLQHYTLESY